MTNRRDARPPLRWGRATIAAVFLCGAAGPAGAAPPAARKTFVITDFDTVRLEGPVDVAIVTGKGSSAIGTGDRDTLDALDLSLSGSILTIRVHDVVTLNSSRGGKPRLATRIALTTGTLKRAIVTGAGNMTADRLKGAATEASLRGPGTLAIGKVDSDRLSLGLLGAGTVTVAGMALDVVATVSGSGRLDAAALDTRRLRITTEGAVDAQAQARETVNASASGPGRLVVSGPGTCTVRKIGSASVTCSGEVY